MLWRYGVVIGVIAVGVKAEGVAGGFMAFVIFGIAMCFIYTLIDGWNRLREGMSRQQITIEDHSQNLHLNTMPGQPTDQEWAAITEIHRQIETRRNYK